MKKVTLLVLFAVLLISGVILDLLPIRVPDGLDKIYHFVGFAALTITSIKLFEAFFGKKLINSFMMFILIFGGLFAGISEVLQKLVAVRSCDVNDWVVNLLGIGLVCVVTFLINSKASKIRELNYEMFEFKDLPSTT